MSINRPISELVCGRPTSAHSLFPILTHLGQTLDRIYAEILTLKSDIAAPERLALIGPFLGRSVIEVTCTALIGRLDPFRVLALREVQMHSGYQPGTRNQASIQWVGDVHSEKAPKQPQDLWSPERSARDMSRALFGDYQDTLFWRSAFEALIDSVPNDRGGDWMRALRRIPSEGFIPNMRQKSNSIYSQCSKGVHHEFVIPVESSNNPESLRTLLREAVEVAAILGFTANSSSDMLFRIDVDEALQCFEDLQEAQ